ncbi:hypothetical protein Tco_0275978 [Tanacetum coccineum]
MPPISSFSTIEKSHDEREICHGYLTKKEHQQLLLDEEALRETLEEEDFEDSLQEVRPSVSPDKFASLSPSSRNLRVTIVYALLTKSKMNNNI